LAKSVCPFFSRASTSILWQSLATKNWNKKMQTSLSTNPARDQANSNGDEDEEQKQEQNGAYRD
jgi:hypothetical protein